MLDDGMSVVDPDQEQIGRVTQRGEGSFTVSRPTGGEVTLPYDLIQAIQGQRIVLKVHANQVEGLSQTREA